MVTRTLTDRGTVTVLVLKLLLLKNKLEKGPLEREVILLLPLLKCQRSQLSEKKNSKHKAAR